jgi:hypothetical protein
MFSRRLSPGDTMYSVFALLGLDSVVDLGRPLLLCPVGAAGLCPRQPPSPVETVFDIAFDFITD